ncbi:peptidylprolyl isomerase [Paenibacillus sp. V4I7]|uniref:peptidylprolyl isomerase n=1 Tax=Paenibacillus sp. V4I7 TaxID=3042307 RepID=UPI002780E50A|nr:peptidylprolyl isomerase [Paenibacillus sp. V4I7]MDQ0897816.1 parvulin-like peptidyl-prolyl isomerase [Paenibacillus sp. V4I7]
MKQSKRINRIFKKKIFFAVLLPLLATVLLSASLIVSHSSKYSGGATVFTVNGEPVSKDEFMNVMSGLRANVFSYFVQKYGVTDSAKFWATSFQGEIPIEVLKQKTLDKMKRIKTEQIVMKSNGIASDISYSGFLDKLKAENERRKKAVENKQAIYGPQQFDATGYYEVLHGNRMEELKNKLADKELLSSDEEIKNAYDENKETMYKKIDSIKYEKIVLSYLDEKGNPSPDKKKIAASMATRIKEDTNKGLKFEDIVNAYKKQDKSDIEYKGMAFNESTYKTDVRTYPQLTTTLNELKNGQISDVIEESASFNIVRVLEKSIPSYKTLDEVREQVKKELTDKKVDEFINKLVHGSKLIVDNKAYNSIS